MVEKKLRTKNVFDKKYEFFNLTLIYLILGICFAGVRVFATFNLLEGLGDYEELVYSLIIQVGIMFGLAFFLYKTIQKRSAKEVFKDFKFVKISFKAVLICIGLGILLIFINIGFNSIYSFIISLFGYEPTTTTISSYALPLFLLTIFTSAILPGFCEEFANRGLVLRAFKNLSFTKIIVLSGFLFALMHMNIGQFGYAFIAGMLFAFTCLTTGSIFPGMIIHFMNNAIIEYLSFASVNNLFLGDFYTSISTLSLTTSYLSSVLIIFMILLTVVFLFGWLLYLLIKEVRGGKFKEIEKDLSKTFENSEEKPETLSVKIPLSNLGINLKAKYKPKFWEKIPLYSVIFLTGVVTLMTLIWSSL